MFVAALWIAPAALAVVDEIAQRRLMGQPPPTTQDLFWRAGDWLVYVVLTPIIFGAVKRWPIVRPHLLRRILLHLGISLFFCVAWAVGGRILQVFLRWVFENAAFHAQAAKLGPKLWPQIFEQTISWIFTTLPFGVVVYLTVAGLAHAIRYFVEARDREVQVARLAEQLTGARFAALQAQVNPHFLFNTLNTIAVLVRDNDRPGAVRIVEQLSDVLRRTLTRHRANEVPLEEEIELVRQYLAIEQARFSDRLRPSFDVDDALLTAAVPSFAIQHLVENAIRHGIARRTDAGQVRVSARRDGDVLEIMVADDGAGIAADLVPAPGHGIENTRERLRALHGERGSLVVQPGPTGGTIATLRVPYRVLPTEANLGAR
jgi:two-component system, LytTR family, sensor kinase